MATLPAATAAPVNKPTPLPSQRHFRHTKLFFRPFSKPKLAVFTKGHWNRGVVRSQLNKVAVGESSNAAASSSTKADEPASEEKDVKATKCPSSAALVSDASVSEFMTQVASLVKLVDSRDIVELQLKQLDCELIIRKKEALPQPPASSPVVMMHSPSPQAVMPSHFPPPEPTAASTATGPVPSSASVTSLPPPLTKSAKSSHPPLKCPMAGTFYRSPGPNEPSFVKVGDKVKKGQVLCIIEAMKLMNEIEADQAGTIVEILADDGKPVAVDMDPYVRWMTRVPDGAGS